jgi:hypothetical protein
MRTTIYVLVCLALGGVLGWWVAEMRIDSSPWDGTGAGIADIEANSGAKRATARDGKTLPGPRVSLDEDTYDFGTMEQKGTDKHDFIFKNLGDAPLKLTKGATTCSCTLANVDNDEVPPGGTTKITLKWHGKLFHGPYNQSATILTNDLRRPEVTLRITGRIVALLKAEPTSVSLSSVSSSRESTAEVKFFSFADAPLTLTQPEWLDPRLAESFAVRFDAMPAEDLKNEKGAKSGLIARLTVKPGLPIGTFRQTLRMRSNVKDLTEVELPIQGAVVGAISVVGRDWNDERRILMLGPILQSAGAQRELRLLCRGPDRDKFKFRIAERSPSFLEAEIEKDEPGGVIRQVYLNIRVPKGSPVASHYGDEEGSPYGRVLLDTGVPGMAQVLIQVRFAVVTQ